MPVSRYAGDGAFAGALHARQSAAQPRRVASTRARLLDWAAALRHAGAPPPPHPRALWLEDGWEMPPPHTTLLGPWKPYASLRPSQSPQTPLFTASRALPRRRLRDAPPPRPLPVLIRHVHSARLAQLDRGDVRRSLLLVSSDTTVVYHF